ncbi:MAG: GWxTD domain-containing protein [Gemmatimonadales bacterium]
MLPVLLVLLQQDSLLARAESLLAAQDLRAARAIAEHLVARRPDDPRSHFLLGRIWYAWPVTGRYAALAEFRAAARLAPRDPAPLYWQVRVGQFLGSDEGEVVVRQAILKIFALAPDYEDCWALFLELHHSEDIWHRADQALAHHPDDVVAQERRARIALALEEPARADSLAARVLESRAPYVPGYLLRAEAAFGEAHDSAGYAWYDSAQVHADLDSTGAVWEQIWMIASPLELERHQATAPGERREYFEWFWARRDPNLVTPRNERIAEHFRRFAEVRRMFRLLHPYASFHRSPSGRTLAASFQRDLAAAGGGPTPDSVSPVNFLLADLRDYNDTLGRLSVYARANLSARGLVWLRHGRPHNWNREQGNFTAVDEWTYHTVDGPLTITFAGIPFAFGWHGDDIVAPPASRHQARQVRQLLTTDNTSLPATLLARGWSAFFKSAEPGNTDLYLKTVPESAAVALRDTAAEAQIAAARGPGVLRLTAPPGPYRLALDVDSGGAVGRIRERIRLPGYSFATFAVSSLVLAPGDSLGTREGTLTDMPADLVYPAGRALSAYAEVYGVSRDRDGRARYGVRYTFRPLRSVVSRLLGRASPVVFEFAREAEWRGALAERLVIEPGRLPPGRYRVTLVVTDLPSNVKSETVALDIAIR